MDRLKLMDTFVRVVRGQSFTAAATQLGVTRGVITKHISLLEAGFGVRLINRTTRQLSLTEAGSSYFEFCSRVLREIEDAEGVLTQLQDEPRGSIKITAPKAFASLCLGQLVAEFSRKYPSIEVAAFVSDFPIDQINLVEHGFDLVIRLSRPTDSSIIARQICDLHWILCASPDYLKRNAAVSAPKDLVNRNCLIHTRLAGGDAWRFHDGKSETIVKVSGPMKSNSVMMLRGAARDGLGIALLPDYCIADDIRSGRLCRLLPQYAGPTDELFVLFPYSEHVPKKVRLFVDFLVKKLTSPPWSLAPRRRKKIAG